MRNKKHAAPIIQASSSYNQAAPNSLQRPSIHTHCHLLGITFLQTCFSLSCESQRDLPKMVLLLRSSVACTNQIETSAPPALASGHLFSQSLSHRLSKRGSRSREPKCSISKSLKLRAAHTPQSVHGIEIAFLGSKGKAGDK